MAEGRPSLPLPENLAVQRILNCSATSWGGKAMKSGFSLIGQFFLDTNQGQEASGVRADSIFRRQRWNFDYS